jgi:terminase small subunit / prophage DNA-packing protein
MDHKIDLESLKQIDLARFFNKNERTIQRWHEQGLPRHGEGKGCYYVWAEVLPWYVAFVSGSTGGDSENMSHKNRLEKVKADDAELDFAVKRGTLLVATKVREQWANECAAMRGRLLSIPAMAALKIDASHSQAQREEIIRRDIYEALENLKGEAE